MDLWTTVRPAAERIDPRIVDTVLAALCAGFGLHAAFTDYPAAARPFDGWGVLLCLVSGLSVAARRAAPMTVLFVSCAASGLSQYAGYWIAMNQLGPQLAFTTVAALRPKRWAALGTATLLPVLLACNLHTWQNSRADTVLLTASWVVVLWIIGDGVRRMSRGNRRLAERNAQLAALTEQLAAEQRERARRAVLDERVRIARELHDVVAHHMSVIAVQAELASYVFDTDPPTARGALTTIADVGRETLAELNHMLSALRAAGDDEPDGGPAGTGLIPVPPAGLARLPELTDRIRAAGVPLRVSVLGAARPLPDGLDQCAYRIVQESLTNLVKHSAPSTAELSVEYRGEELVITMENDGVPGPGGDDASSSKSGSSALGSSAPVSSEPRHGLIGMAERARIYGGTLTAAAQPGGRFRMSATLPLSPAARPRRTQPFEEHGDGDTGDS